jgi:hypothetical protein
MLQLLQPKNTDEDIFDGLKKSGCYINASKHSQHIFPFKNYQICQWIHRWYLE